MTSTAVDDQGRRRGGVGSRIWRLLAVFGPGILVMLADTDAGSIVTAAQSGAQWGYKLLLFQLVLIPILFVVQELTARLGIVTGKGHAVLIREHYGATWAWISTTTLVVACAGALLTEFGGIAAVGSLVHLPVWLSLLLAVGALAAMAVTGSYPRASSGLRSPSARSSWPSSRWRSSPIRAGRNSPRTRWPSRSPIRNT